MVSEYIKALEERRDTYKAWCEIVKEATPMMEALARKVDQGIVDLLEE